MNFFAQCLVTEWRRLLKHPGRCLFLLLLPLSILGLRWLLPAQEILPAIPVGWAMPEESIYGRELLSRLRSEEGLIEFIPADEAELRSNVASGKWECGFVLRADFDSRVEKQRWSRLFTLVRSESSTVYALVSEAVSSAMLGMVSGEIGSAYLDSIGVPAPESGWELDSAQRLEIIPAYGEQPGLEGVAYGLGKNLLNGAAAILLTVLSLSMGDYLALERQSISRRRMAAVRGEWAVLLPALAARFVLLAALAGLGLAGQTKAAGLLALCLRLTALMGLLSFLPGGWSAVVLPFVPLVMLVLCPVLFDAGALLPALAPLCAVSGASVYLNGAVWPNLAAGLLYGLGAGLAGRLCRS